MNDLVQSLQENLLQEFPDTMTTKFNPTFPWLKPAIFCLPGAWVSLAIYYPITEELRKHGYCAFGVMLPSADANPSHEDFGEDVKAVRDKLVQLVEDEQRDVVLVSHAYSGMLACEAPVGLGKKERKEKGLKGGVTRLVFVQAYVGAEGFCPMPEGKEFPEWMEVDVAVSPSRKQAQLPNSPTLLPLLDALLNSSLL